MTRRVPWATLAVVSAGLAAGAWPSLLEYRRDEPWRLLTGQLVHWSARMAVADLGALLVLGAWLERRSRAAAAGALVAGATATALVLAFSSLDRYRGASGLASALFAALALDLAREGSRPVRAAALAALALFAAKGVFEVATGRTVFAGPLPAGVRPIPAVHAAGALAGALAWGISRRARRMDPSG